MKNRIFVVMLLCLVSAACGPKKEFRTAVKLEQKGRPHEAWKQYQKFVAHYPSHALAAEAMFRAGWLAQHDLKDCYVAQNFYDTVLERYPQSDPWARAALLQKNGCPDYIPLLAGTKWTEGDSDTKGGNARIEVVVNADKSAKILPGEQARFQKTYYAGATKFRTLESLYQKKNSELIEFPVAREPGFKILMRWPLEMGSAWSCKYNGQMFRYEVVATNLKVTVTAGEFENCIKVRSYIEGFPGSTFEYYAPGVGRILTSLLSKQDEKRNTELLTFTKGAPISYEEWSGLK